MNLTKAKKKVYEEVYQIFLNDERILRMKDIPMHRGSNCYIHSFRVCKLAVKRALSTKDVDLYVVILGAILHDYYLYDWRKEKDKKRKHMSVHPHIAVENAERDFDIPKEVKKVIESHMWPVNLFLFPKSKEARLVSGADKTIYLKEIFTPKWIKRRREKKYLKEISTLFDD